MIGGWISSVYIRHLTHTDISTSTLFRSHSVRASCLAGAQSPGICGHGSPQSPAMTGASTFAGDKRSYKIVSEIAKQIGGISTKGGSADQADDHHGVGCSYLGADVAAEKCSLLVSMLHHQLKQVKHRSADPSQSKMTNRDIRSSRLTPKNMVELLRHIGKAFVMLTEGLSVRPPAFFQIQEYQATKEYWMQAKRNIMLRLLTSQLLLFQALEISFLQDGPLSSSNDVYMCTFRIAVQSIREEFQEGESALLGEYYDNSTAPTGVSYSAGGKRDGGYMRGRLSSSQAIVQVCLRLLKCITPRDVSAIGVSDYEQWEEEMDSSGIAHLLLSALHEMCERGQSKVAAEHDYTKLDDALRSALGARGGAHARSRGYGVSTPGRAPAGAPPPPRSVSWWALQCVLDFVLFEGTNTSSLLFASLLRGGLLHVLSESPVFREMKTVLCDTSTLPAATVAALMGYKGPTGEVSALASAWSKVIQIFQCAIRCVQVPWCVSSFSHCVFGTSLQSMQSGQYDVFDASRNKKQRLFVYQCLPPPPSTATTGWKGPVFVTSTVLVAGDDYLLQRLLHLRPYLESLPSRRASTVYSSPSKNAGPLHNVARYGYSLHVVSCRRTLKVIILCLRCLTFNRG